MEVMPSPNMKTSLVTSLALLCLITYCGSAAGCELSITSSIPIGKPILGEEIGPYNITDELTLTCSEKLSGNCGQMGWWEEGCGQLIVGPSLTLTLKKDDAGRRLQCIAGEVKETIQLQIKDNEGMEKFPCITTTPDTTTHEITMIETSSSSSSSGAPSVQKMTTGAVQQQQTKRTERTNNLDDQRSETATSNNSLFSSVSQIEELDEAKKNLKGSLTHIYLIGGGVVVVGILAVVAIIAVTLVYRRVREVTTHSHAQSSAGSEQESSSESTEGIVRPPIVGEVFDPLLIHCPASLSADYKDHSYYYIDETNSYLYPDITQEVREQILRDSI